MSVETDADSFGELCQLGQKRIIHIGTSRLQIGIGAPLAAELPRTMESASSELRRYFNPEPGKLDPVCVPVAVATGAPPATPWSEQTTIVDIPVHCRGRCSLAQAHSADYQFGASPIAITYAGKDHMLCAVCMSQLSWPAGLTIIYQTSVGEPQTGNLQTPGVRIRLSNSKHRRPYKTRTNWCYRQRISQASRFPAF